METEAQSRPVSMGLGAREACKVFLVTLISLFLANLCLILIIDYFRDAPGIYSLRGRSSGEINALRTIILGFVNPIVIVTTTTALLRLYFPAEPISALCKRIGMAGRPSALNLVIAFLVGATYVFTFMGLSYFFPPGEFVAPHPLNVINQSSFLGKIVFALAACTLVPIAEEVLFRGVLYQGLAHSWGKVVSTLFVSAAFIAVHPDTLKSGYWVTHLALYLSPILMISLREIMGNLYAPIAAHSGYNVAEIFF